MRGLQRLDPLAVARGWGDWTGHPLFRPTDTLRGGQWLPPLDLIETPDAFVVALELPGVPMEAIEVTYDAGTLLVRGEKQAGPERSGEGMFERVERSFGRFERAVRVSAPIDAEQIAASYSDGILEIRLPKSEGSGAKRIDVAAAPLTIAAEPEAGKED